MEGWDPGTSNSPLRTPARKLDQLVRETVSKGPLAFFESRNDTTDAPTAISTQSLPNVLRELRRHTGVTVVSLIIDLSSEGR